MIVVVWLVDCVVLTVRVKLGVCDMLDDCVRLRVTDGDCVCDTVVVCERDCVTLGVNV